MNNTDKPKTIAICGEEEIELFISKFDSSGGKDKWKSYGKYVVYLIEQIEFLEKEMVGEKENISGKPIFEQFQHHVKKWKDSQKEAANKREILDSFIKTNKKELALLVDLITEVINSDSKKTEEINERYRIEHELDERRKSQLKLELEASRDR